MDLKEFCSKNRCHIHHGINEPFSKGEWTYATNGHICIRVPRLAYVMSEKGPDAANLFTEAGNLPGEVVWQQLPPFELIEHPCEDCNGTGLLHICNYCKGNGCGHCRGSGSVGTRPKKGVETWPCEDCDGTGKIGEVGNIIMDGSTGEKVRVSAIYLDKIKDLPNVQIAPHSSEGMIRIKFDGGEGLLMPVWL